VDIYANRIEDNTHLDEIADLMLKLRTTDEASNLFDSTQHALVRNYIDNNYMDMLVHVLSNRSEYGIFLDHYSANMLLDKMIQEKNFKLGARFATLIALQEDFENPITTYMSLYNCYKFAKNLEIFEDLLEKPVEVVEEEVATKGKKKKGEIRIRVRYLLNPHFDDHFDLKNTNHLLGKTFLYLADEVLSSNETLSNSLKLIGFSLYEKFDKGNEFLDKATNSFFFKETVELVKSFSEKVENLDTNEPAKNFFAAVNSLSSLKNENVDEIIEKSIQKAIEEQASKDIEGQKKLYATWIEEREQKLNHEIHRMQRIQRLVNIEKMQEDLDQQEKKLWFFENEEQIDLEIESKRVFYPKRWFGKKKKPRKVDVNYIPPDVDARRNVK